jgi:hypothetical protein
MCFASLSAVCFVGRAVAVGVVLSVGLLFWSVAAVGLG